MAFCRFDLTRAARCARRSGRARLRRSRFIRARRGVLCADRPGRDPGRDGRADRHPRGIADARGARRRGQPFERSADRVAFAEGFVAARSSANCRASIPEAEADRPNGCPARRSRFREKPPPSTLTAFGARIAAGGGTLVGRRGIDGDDAAGQPSPASRTTWARAIPSVRRGCARSNGRSECETFQMLARDVAPRAPTSR